MRVLSRREQGVLTDTVCTECIMENVGESPPTSRLKISPPGNTHSVHRFFSVPDRTLVGG